LSKSREGDRIGAIEGPVKRAKCAVGWAGQGASTKSCGRVSGARPPGPRRTARDRIVRAWRSWGAGPKTVPHDLWERTGEGPEWDGRYGRRPPPTIGGEPRSNHMEERELGQGRDTDGLGPERGEDRGRRKEDGSHNEFRNPCRGKMSQGERFWFDCSF